MERICPLQKAQLLGAKLPGKMRISAMNGSDTVGALLPSIARGEDALEGDDEVDHEVGLEVGMGLAAPGVGDGGRRQVAAGGGGVGILGGRRPAPVGRVPRVGGGRVALR